MMRSSRGQTFLLLFSAGALFPVALAPLHYWPGRLALYRGTVLPVAASKY